MYIRFACIGSFTTLIFKVISKTLLNVSSSSWNCPYYIGLMLTTSLARQPFVLLNDQVSAVDYIRNGQSLYVAISDI